jgi:hypothetical protein
MIVHIIIQNKLYSEFELDLIFESAVEIIVIDIAENILKFASPIKRETLI